MVHYVHTFICKDLVVIDFQSEHQQFETMVGATERLMAQHLQDRSQSAERLPIDWRDIPTEIFGIDREAPMSQLFERIRKSYEGWLPYIQERFELSDAELTSLRQARQASYLIGTLTEDNLPGYKVDIHQINQYAPLHAQDVLATGLGVWTAEEDAHGRGLNAFGELTDLIASKSYTQSRTSQLRHGSSATPHSLMHMKVYTSLQEPMANIAHQKDAAVHDPIGHGILQAIAADEARHGKWFRGEVSALAEAFPDQLITELHGIIHNGFKMPGTEGIQNYKKMSTIVAAANLLTIEDFRSTVVSAMHQWGVHDLLPKTDEAKLQQEALIKEFLGSKTESFVERIVKPGRFVLGHTLTVTQLREARADYKNMFI